MTSRGRNLMQDDDDDDEPEKTSRPWTEWSISQILGIDRCCAVESFIGVQEVAQPLASSDGVRSAEASRRDAPRVDPQPAPAKKKGFMSGLVGSITVAMGGKTEEEKLQEESEKKLELVKGGSIFTRRVKSSEKGGGAVWLELSVDEDECGAKIQWRNPQLVLNRAVNQERIELDACQTIRKATPSDAPFFPNGGPSPREEELCFVLAGGGKTAVFEAHSPEVAEAWVAGLKEASSTLVRKLDANRQKKLADERRQREMEERRATRDARRAEYAKAGMSNTARIMAMGTGRK